jgi:phosphoribosylformylglycinamidine synthase subunit PurS
MKARVTVSPKKTVLDPQGQAIGSALKGRGYAAVQDVRQGKVFEIELATGTDGGVARQQMEEIARDILSNPVIEDFRVEILD